MPERMGKTRGLIGRFQVSIRISRFKSSHSQVRTAVPDSSSSSRGALLCIPTLGKSRNAVTLHVRICAGAVSNGRPYRDRILERGKISSTLRKMELSRGCNTITDGAVTNYTYNYNPDTQTATISNPPENPSGTKWKRTTLDGFGRIIKSPDSHLSI